MLNNKLGKSTPTYDNTLFTGIATFKPLVFNPTSEELQKLGLPAKETIYISDEFEPRLNNLTLYGEVDLPTGKKILRINFWLKDQCLPNSKGNYTFINSVGRTINGESVEAITSNPNLAFLGTDLRKSFEYEGRLYEFLIKLGQLDTDLVIQDTEGNEMPNVIKLDNDPFTLEGVAELNDYIKAMVSQGATIKVLLNTDGKYQNIICDKYTDSFIYAKSTKLAPKFKANIQKLKNCKIQDPDFRLKVYEVELDEYQEEVDEEYEEI